MLKRLLRSALTSRRRHSLDRETYLRLLTLNLMILRRTKTLFNGAYLSRFLHADLDCNGIVGVSDFLELLGLWGPCLGCPADLDCNGTVGVNDLLNLLGAWGTCDPNPPGEIPRTVQDCYNKFYPNDLDALIACIEAIE